MPSDPRAFRTIQALGLVCRHIACNALTLLATLSLFACERTPADVPASRQAVAIAPSVAAPAPATTRTFLPSQHGFAFVNAFKGSPIPPSLRPLQRVLGSTVPDHFGLCGGMCAVAADYFLADMTVPGDTAAPKQGDPLYEYLYQRQADSYGGIGVPLRVLAGMATPDAGAEGLDAMNARELPAIRSRLTTGELVQLCLVLGKADGKTKPWDNHQVLAYAEGVAGSDAAATEPVVLRIYDPNYPKDDAATLTFLPTADGLSCYRTAHRRASSADLRTMVRGVFAAPYTRRDPAATAAR